MAEYIDREKLLDELGESANHHAESGREYQLLLRDRNIVREQPTADVIERSKIDKAIEELRKEIEENHLNVIEYADGEWIVKDFVYGAIDRLREKIGE